MHVRQIIHTRQRQAHGFGAGGEQQPVEMNLLAVTEHDLACADVDFRYTGFQAQFDVLLGVKLIPAQWDPFLRRVSGQIVLGQIGPVHGRRVVITQHDNLALKTLATQHLSSGEARRAATDDDDLARRFAHVCNTDDRCRCNVLAHEHLVVG